MQGSALSFKLLLEGLGLRVKDQYSGTTPLPTSSIESQISKEPDEYYQSHTTMLEEARRNTEACRHGEP